jgi:hypothetical protein
MNASFETKRGLSVERKLHRICPAAWKHEKCFSGLLSSPWSRTCSCAEREREREREIERERLVATSALLGILSTVRSAQTLAMPLANSQNG